MSKIPAKVSDRLANGLKRFQPIIDGARARDVGEADTVTIVKDMLAEIFGYNKYTEITSEHLIRGTFCDLAVELDGKLAFLIEVKAAGLELKDSHVKQAVDYAANQGCEWVALTNAQRWQVFRVTFGKPIEHTLIADICIPNLSHRKGSDLEMLWLISREGWLKSHLDEYAAQQEALSRFTIGALLLTPGVLTVLRRELRRISPDAKIDIEQVETVLQMGVIKREVLEGEKAAGAKRLIARAAKRALREAGSPGGKAATGGVALTSVALVQSS
ncbi:MAG: type I restriction enzyme HsdR N-terminal domain-containing protein [Gemmatimonadales bacterium]|nr:type I restriction enzyme HsdR N-terminal domain-containing protein [Gemmatimonadales bacterium]